MDKDDKAILGMVKGHLEGLQIGIEVSANSIDILNNPRKQVELYSKTCDITMRGIEKIVQLLKATQ